MPSRALPLLLLQFERNMRRCPSLPKTLADAIHGDEASPEEDGGVHHQILRSLLRESGRLEQAIVDVIREVARCES